MGRGKNVVIRCRHCDAVCAVHEADIAFDAVNMRHINAVADVCADARARGYRISIEPGLVEARPCEHAQKATT